MRKYIILFFSVSLFLYACKGSAPDGIISQDEMVGLLTQVHITDATLLNMSQEQDTLYKYGTERYLVLFKKFHTDTAQFRRSYKYYTTQPDKLTAIYDQVLKNLQAKSDSITKLLAVQNTRAGKKPALPTGAPGKFIPQLRSPGPAMPGASNVPFRPGVNMQLMQKNRARADSINKKRHPHHASSVE
jgi:hypothetical protein